MTNLTRNKVFHAGPVYPLVPAYNNNGYLDTDKVKEYIHYLEINGAKVLTTTAGTSQFNLLTSAEIAQLNSLASNNFNGAVILGLPQLSLNALKEQIWFINENIINDKAAIMLLFPERYYNDNQVVHFFHEAAEESDFPVFIHGLVMKSGINGDPVPYSADLINRLAKIPNIIGMKEEQKTLDKAYDFCYTVDSEFIKILAGKGMQKYLSLLPVVDDQTTYLVGVGSVLPLIEEEFWEHCKNGEYGNAALFVKNLETPFFKVAFKNGWHLSLRTAIEECGLSNLYNLGVRKPFPRATKGQREEIKQAYANLVVMFSCRGAWEEE